MNDSRINLWVGIFVTLGIAAVLFLALKVGNLMTWGAPEGYHLVAHFDNIGGLKPQAPVKSAGVVVGRVEKISLDPKTFEAVATLKVFPQYQFSKDTIAAIFTSGLLGEQFLGLEVGGDSVNLKDGDKISKTQSAIQIEKLISQFMFSKAAEGAPSTPSTTTTPSVSSPTAQEQKK
ncbi:MAG: hypothetical protein RLZZ502_1463 [Pseudomonadota bacterium]|jgi:phospholipid/cholesterol/gamma-HCH transport system substrate-binding protein